MNPDASASDVERVSVTRIVRKFSSGFPANPTVTPGKRDPDVPLATMIVWCRLVMRPITDRRLCPIKGTRVDNGYARGGRRVRV